MANVSLSPNMNMPIPVVGVDPGPDWALNIDSCLTILDGHNHSLGTGVQITPSGINISSDLTFNNNNATTLRSVRFTPQGSALSTGADIGCIYEVGVDLYYNDGSGNQIRITQGGSVTGSSGTITGLPSGTASAAYSAGTFIFQSATNTPANIDGGSITIRNDTANANGVTLTPVNALASGYTLVLPTLPPVQSIMALDPSGNITAPYTVDNATIVINSNVIEVGVIQTANIANSAVTGAKIAASTVMNSNIISAGLSINTGVVVFNTVGSTTWTVPSNVTRCIVYACSGGGGGGGGGGTNPGTAGSAGGLTSFNGITLAGGSNGGGGGGPGAAGQGGVCIGSSYADFYWGGNGLQTGGGTAGSGQSSPDFAGGAGANDTTSSGAGGGASTYGAGGAGGFAGSTGPVAGVFGSGGGGGAGSGVTPGGGSAAGGAGSKATINIIDVTSGASIPIVIGAGGAGGIKGDNNAQTGAVGGDGYMVIYY
jgi:hypothetical protein